MTKGIQILEEVFPNREIPTELKEFLSPIPISRPDLLTASPSRLLPPFSLPGLEEIVRLLTEDLSSGRAVTVRPGSAPDGVTAISLLARIFRPYRRRIRPEAETGNAGNPTLEFDAQLGIRYRRDLHSVSLPPAAPGGGRYSATGLVFKLGQGRQLTEEKGFGRQYVAFDLETTGKDPRRDEIIEIGAVRISGGRMGEEFSALVKPSRPLPRLITEITGITDRDLENAPPLEEVLPKFLDFVGEAVLIAHNIEFDYAFLKQAARRLLKRRLTNETFCTLAAARARMPGQNHRLGAVAEALGVELKNWHRATADARAAALIFLHFQEEDNAPKRYEYFRQAVGRACLGTLLARAPISGDNAVFFRNGFENLVREYEAGERYFRRRTEREAESDRPRPADLDSWRRKKRGRAVYRLVRQTLLSPRRDNNRS